MKYYITEIQYFLRETDAQARMQSTGTVLYSLFYVYYLI